jgi:hypothetical protein
MKAVATEEHNIELLIQLKDKILTDLAWTRTMKDQLRVWALTGRWKHRMCPVSHILCVCLFVLIPPHRLKGQITSLREQTSRSPLPDEL